ncbi:hypothetical protein [Nonomuraea guangzhouensis]|uniref:Endonuclease/exonuclease/phosphatase domain-containing protein n=1 Tax=Nonomuraea guangzhouensis TaxID=1291555 RepID=A0ABW4G9S9_9ACTN|nr:hypothetical protein [Nonomuraea guangzhouensis]
MNWNIEHLSDKKLTIAGMATAIARTIAAADVDIVLLLEVRQANVNTAMATLSNALNAAEPGAAGNNWRGYFLSQPTGSEYYAALIRDLDAIRPVVVSTGPPGTVNQPLEDLRHNVFTLWPSANWAATAYPVAAARPALPICDVFVTPGRAAKRARFAGQTIANGGFALGNGFRLPALAMFWIHTAGGDYLVPFVVCHYAAVRGAAMRNVLGQAQFAQLKGLHIAQLFNDNPAGAGTSGYLDVLDATNAHQAKQVEEVCFTGDFNINFLRNLPAGNKLTRTNNAALGKLTPTPQRGGSATPPAPAGAPGAVPALPYGAALPPPPTASQMPDQILRAAVTTQGTIQRAYPLPNPLPAGPPPAPYASAAFDNFFYGGTRLTSAAVAYGVGAADAGQVVNVPANVVQGVAAAAGQIGLATVAAHYTGKAKKNAALAPNLQLAPGGPALSAADRLIGARLLSDHLPVVLTFTCP